MAKTTTKWIADDAVTKEKINPDVAGDGLEQAAGGEIDLQADAVGGANLARAVNVDPTNGAAVKIDDTTIKENGSQQLSVGANAINATHIDETSNYNWSGTHDFQSGTTHVGTPSSDTHAVTKAYADALANGAKFKDVCRALADSNQTLSGLPTNIDSVTGWSDSERVINTAQTIPTENGIWEVHAGAWTRPADFNTGDGASGAQTWIDQGVTYGESQWSCTTDEPNDLIDTNNLAWIQTSGAGQINAGTGLTKNGNTVHAGDGTTGDRGGLNFSADDIAAAPDNLTLETVSDQLQVKDLGISTAKLAPTSATAAKLGSDVAGVGLGGGAGAAIDLDIPSLTAETTPAVDDLLAVYDTSAGAHRKMTRDDLLQGLSIETIKHEMHKITVGEVTNGYFTLGAGSPVNNQSVRARVVNGPTQINKAVVGATGATPDFDIISTSQFHFNNNGAAIGLSEDLGLDDIVIIEFHA